MKLPFADYVPERPLSRFLRGMGSGLINGMMMFAAYAFIGTLLLPALPGVLATKALAMSGATALGMAVGMPLTVGLFSGMMAVKRAGEEAHSARRVSHALARQQEESIVATAPMMGVAPSVEANGRSWVDRVGGTRAQREATAAGQHNHR